MALAGSVWSQELPGEDVEGWVARRGRAIAQEDALTYQHFRSLAASFQAKQAVMVTVNDQGIEISPEERERIFERSFRGRGALFASGSSLGLYISREIFERHGGRL